jgi:hypothetical protein
MDVTAAETGSGTPDCRPPHVIEFLQFLRQHDKKIWLVTAAHSKTLDLKLRKERIGHILMVFVRHIKSACPKKTQDSGRNCRIHTI